MGNCSSEAQQAKLFRIGDLNSDPTAFRVFVKKRNKHIAGWLKINDDEIIYTRGGNNFQFWPLAYLRRYGYTCSGVFFFESGRRCASGEGFWTKFAPNIFNVQLKLVQSKIKIEEYARGSRASSASNNNRMNSVNPPQPPMNARIHPVQRFYSENANNKFALSMNGDPRCLHQQQQAYFNSNNYQDSRRIQSPSCSLASAPIYNSGLISASDQRPRSVLSAMSHSVRAGHETHPGAVPLLSSNNLLNHSFHSAIDNGSPWPTQQQIDGEIVLEHVLSRGYDRQRSAFDCANCPNTNYRPPPPLPPKHHTYVNIDFLQLTPAPVRELYRTSQSRKEFLNSGPCGFVFHPEVPSAPKINGSGERQFASSPMQRSFHQTTSARETGHSIASKLPTMSASFSMSQKLADKNDSLIKTSRNGLLEPKKYNPKNFERFTAFRPITAVTVTKAPNQPDNNGKTDEKTAKKCDEKCAPNYAQIDVEKTKLLFDEVANKQ